MLALAVGAVVLASPAAMAGGTLTVVRARFPAYFEVPAGPAFAGSAIAWATPRLDRGFDVTIDRAGSLTSHYVATKLGDVVDTDFAASSTHTALAVDVESCDGGCKYMLYRSIESDVFAAALGQSFVSVGCAGGSLSGAESVDLSGSVVGFFDRCAGGVVVRDLAAPGTPSRMFPGVDLVRLAGPYLAVDSVVPYKGSDFQPPPRVTVYDLRTGQVVFSVSGRPPFDIQADGKLVFQTAGANPRFAWASPADPLPHPLAPGPTSRYADLPCCSEVRIADDRIAVRTGTYDAPNPSFTVYDLHGNELATAQASNRVASFDFDGNQLVYASQPCEVMGIVTWDLHGPPPTLARGRCPAPRASRAVVDFRHRVLRIPVHCPRAPALGCSGIWDTVLYRPHFDSLAGHVDAIGPGSTTTFREALSRSQACAFARHRVRRVTIQLSPSGSRPHAPDPPRRLRVTTIGRAHSCR